LPSGRQRERRGKRRERLDQRLRLHALEIQVTRDSDAGRTGSTSSRPPSLPPKTRAAGTKVREPFAHVHSGDEILERYFLENAGRRGDLPG